MKNVTMTLLVSACASIAAAQQPLTEKVDVNLVNVDVTVTARGQTVQGLTKDDFEVREDGVLQTITHFYAVENAPMLVKRNGQSDAASATTAEMTDERFRRKVLLIVDYAHTSKINRNRALERLEHFIDEQSANGQYDWSIELIGSDLKMLLPLTSDKKRIHDCIEAMRHDGLWQPSPDVSPISLDVRLPELDPFRAMSDEVYTAVAFRAVRDGARAFAAADGKKIILLLSAGFGGALDGGFGATPLGAAAAAVASLSRQVHSLREELIREANASNLNFYIIDPEGVVRIGTAGARYWMARQTGGVFLGGNYPERSIQKFDELSSNFYSLAYRPQHAEDFKYHRITVRLKKAGSYHLQYRDGYGSLPIDAQLERTLATPNAESMQTASIPLSVSAGEPRQEKGKLILPVAISVPLKNLQFVPSRTGSDARVNLFVSVFDANGRNLGVTRFVTSAHAKGDETTDHGDLIQNATLRLAKGAHTIVVAVHDQVTDSVGVAKKRIEL